MILLKVKIYNNEQILIPNCSVLDSVIARVRENEKWMLLDILSLSSQVTFIVLGLDLIISIQNQDTMGNKLYIKRVLMCQYLKGWLTPYTSPHPNYFVAISKVKESRVFSWPSPSFCENVTVYDGCFFKSILAFEDITSWTTLGVIISFMSMFSLAKFYFVPPTTHLWLWSSVIFWWPPPLGSFVIILVPPSP